MKPLTSYHTIKKNKTLDEWNKTKKTIKKIIEQLKDDKVITLKFKTNKEE